jgi:ATP-binding cassette subfamily G (WHITE) protein 2
MTHVIGYYSTLSYFLATFSVELPILMGIVIIYGCVSYWMVGLEPSASAFFIFLVIIFLVINVGFAVSQVIATLVNTSMFAIAIYMVVLVYSLLLGGFIVSKNSRFLM